MPAGGAPATIVWWSSTGISHANGLPRLQVLPWSSDHWSTEQPTVRSSLNTRPVFWSTYRYGSSVVGGNERPATIGLTSFQLLLPSYVAKIFVCGVAGDRPSK